MNYRMRALMAVLPNDTVIVYCPHCRKATEEFQDDDYVKENCLIWCEDCGEILICPTGWASKSGTVYAMLDGLAPMDDCTQLVSYAAAAQMVPGLAPGTAYVYYLVGVLRLTEVVSSEDLDSDSDADEEELPPPARFHKVDATRFKDINCSTAHDGIHLYYKGDCTECGKHYESFIWGD